MKIKGEDIERDQQEESREQERMMWVNMIELHIVQV
jgi:hypothetical protein